MTDFNVDLSPDLVNLGTEGSLDSAVTGGNSLQRKLTGVMVENNGELKMVGRIDDGGMFDDAVAKVGDYENLTKTLGSNFVFINDYYVDYQDGFTGSTREANNLLSMMNVSGIGFNTFTDIDGTTFSSLTSMDKLIIPELEENDLAPDLTSDAKDAIANFVNSGGTLIMFCPDSGDPLTVLNDIFGWSLNDNGVNTPISLSGPGAALFPDESSTLPDLSATDSIDTTTLPANSVSIYTGDGSNETIVAKMPYGDGNVYVLGWDWYGAWPLGEYDGGWNHLLRSILNS